MSDLDEAALARWLSEAVPGQPQLEAVEKFAGGQSNPTYRVDSDAGSYVLRRKPFGSLLPSAHAVEREYRLYSALAPVGFPVPRPVALCEDASVIGVPFFLMELVEGRIFWDSTLPELPRESRAHCYEGMADTLAKLHGIDYEAAGLSTFGRPGQYMQRQVERWAKQYRASQTEEIPEVEKLISWLPDSIPDQTGNSIIHGDYRIDNMIFSSEDLLVKAVLDWELATIGDPLADFAYFALPWVLDRGVGAGLVGIDLGEAGIPTLDQITERYCAATKRDGLPDLHWHFAFNLFRLVGITQGVKKRMIDGNASSANAESAVRHVLPLASSAWEQARLAGAPR